MTTKKNDPRLSKIGEDYPKEPPRKKTGEKPSKSNDPLVKKFPSKKHLIKTMVNQQITIGSPLPIPSPINTKNILAGGVTANNNSTGTNRPKTVRTQNSNSSLSIGLKNKSIRGILNNFSGTNGNLDYGSPKGGMASKRSPGKYLGAEGGKAGKTKGERCGWVGSGDENVNTANRHTGGSGHKG